MSHTNVSQGAWNHPNDRYIIPMMRILGCIWLTKGVKQVNLNLLKFALRETRMFPNTATLCFLLLKRLGLLEEVVAGSDWHQISTAGRNLVFNFVRLRCARIPEPEKKSFESWIDGTSVSQFISGVKKPELVLVNYDPFAGERSIQRTTVGKKRPTTVRAVIVPCDAAWTLDTGIQEIVLEIE